MIQQDPVIMNQRVKFRQGTKAENDAFTGVPGEITVNNDHNTLRVHDNHTPGGTELARSDLTNVSNNDFSTKAAAAGVISSNNNTATVVPDGGTPASTNFQMQMRRGAAVDWAGFNTILAAGELGVVTDSSPLQMKIGDGTTPWNGLPFLGSIVSSGAGVTGATGPAGPAGPAGSSGGGTGGGVAGPTGPAGVAGPAGPAGSASILTNDGIVFHYTFGTSGGADTVMGTGANGFSLIKWNNQITKQNIDYNQATGIFTVTTAGKYHLYSGLQFIMVEGGYYGVTVQKNGATIVENYKGGVVGLTDPGTLRDAHETVSTHVTIDLAVNDTLTVYLGWSADVDIDSLLQTSYPNRNYFGGYLVGQTFGSGGGAGAAGPTGAAGAAGAIGIAGPTGLAGPTGPAGGGGGGAGSAGPTGVAGATGVAGPTGPAGSGGSGSSVTGPKGYVYTGNGVAAAVFQAPFYVDVSSFGYKADGLSTSAATNVTAVNNAIASLPSTGGAIYFPPGIGILNATITINYPASGGYSLTIIGAGSGVSTVQFNGCNGFNVFANSGNHYIHFANLAITTNSSTGAFTGITLTNTVQGLYLDSSDFYSVSFRGSDNAFANYWGKGIYVRGWCNINFIGCNFTGSNLVSGGTGVHLDGYRAGSFKFGIVYNFSCCDFQNIAIGIEYDNYIQGVSVVQSNFVNGATGIYVSPDTSGTNGSDGPAQLAVVACNFNTTADQILIAYPFPTINISNNSFYCPLNHYGIVFSYASANSAHGVNITNNSFYGLGANAANRKGTGVHFGGGAHGVVVANTFHWLVYGVNLIGTSTANVQSNKYVACITNVINKGSNSVGVATE